MKSMMHPIVFGAALITACTAQPAELSDADRAAIEQRFDEVARHIAAGDHAAWANDFTEDGIFMIANNPAARGRAAIQAWSEASARVTSITFSDIEIFGRGDLAWATSAISVAVEGAPGPDTSKQLVVLERQPDGSWLTAAASVSSDLPIPGT